MAGKISVVINTLNEAENIKRAISSVKWADEIVVCDMYSGDKTVEIAENLGAQVVFHKKVGYVEPARNFAISKAKGEWILIIDADEEITEELALKLQEISQNSSLDFIEIPRKNIIFGKWMKASMWWPDYHFRFFKKGKVVWNEEIHSKPKVEGQGLTLPNEERFAIIHHHYTNTLQYIDRMNKYTDIQAKGLQESGYEFNWKDLIIKPLNEFLSRFFAHRGFEDGLHGLALSLLQAFSSLVMYLKVWELEGFKQEDINISQLKELSKKSGRELSYWFKYGNLSKNPIKRVFQKTVNKLF